MDLLPLPDDPTLATFATVLNELGHSAHVLDARWRLVFITDELRRTIGDDGGSTISRLGEHMFGSNEVGGQRNVSHDVPSDVEVRVVGRRSAPTTSFGMAG